ncbi:hypothetical protein B296_00014925 [Ensete ventricosum]|uniref:Uncharacterized protein n=1 Tax=Ensete ventricosum TaxID=4639 RepID=A0A427A7N6_ENSVE|nr:hypothetical protein B296_00014925 [Ensete ventricosum]
MEIKILKEQKEGIHTSTIYRAITTVPSTSVLALPDRGKVFVIGADISGNDEEAQVQLMIARYRKIATHHHPDATVDDELQEYDAPTTRATRKPHEELQIRTQSHRVSALRTRLI